MRRLLYFTVLLLVGARLTLATTFFTTWVNGADADTITQGDLLSWEYDVSQVGGSANVKIYVDTDNSGTLTVEDVLLVSFDQTDGDIQGEEGLPDSSAIPDGRIFSSLGIFGFAPGAYLFSVQDAQDQSQARASLFMRALSPVNIWISGTLSKEDITPPSNELSNIMISAEPEDSEGEIWSGLTDANGDYTINMPDSAANREWKISIIFDSQYSGWIPETDSYHNTSLNIGVNQPYNFHLTLPRTVVYGSVFDENMQLVEVDDYGYLENEHTHDGMDFQIIQGRFQVPAVFGGNDTSEVPFQLEMDGNGLIPNYLVPVSWALPDYNFNLSVGDSIEKNFYVKHTDTTITVVVTKDGAAPGSSGFKISAQNDTAGYTWAVTPVGGVVTLHVRHGLQYGVTLVDWDDSYPLPSGYIVEGPSWLNAVPGDTVHFNLIPSTGRLSGHIGFRGNSGDFFDADQADIQAVSVDDASSFSGQISADSMSYDIAVANGNYNVRFNSYNQDFLAMPYEYQNISVQDQQIDTLNFELNYAHAHLTIHLKGAPHRWNQWWEIQTDGEYPFVYMANTQINSDTSYVFNVCDGNWHIYAPDFGQEYSVSPWDTIITVTPNQSDYYLELVYVPTTGIAARAKIPQNFYVKQNYPNPFNPQTTIEFGLPATQKVLVEIFDINGRKIATLIHKRLKAGVRRITWNGASEASGVYICRINAGSKVVSKRLILIK